MERGRSWGPITLAQTLAEMPSLTSLSLSFKSCRLSLRAIVAQPDSLARPKHLSLSSVSTERQEISDLITSCPLLREVTLRDIQLTSTSWRLLLPLLKGYDHVSINLCPPIQGRSEDGLETNEDWAVVASVLDTSKRRGVSYQIRPSIWTDTRGVRAGGKDVDLNTEGHGHQAPTSDASAPGTQNESSPT